MKRGFEPYRTCVGCRQRKPKKALLRLVCDHNLNLVLDPRQNLPGRGAYLCQDPECAQKAMKRKTISYALRQPLTISPEILKIFQAGGR